MGTRQPESARARGEKNLKLVFSFETNHGGEIAPGNSRAQSPDSKAVLPRGMRRSFLGLQSQLRFRHAGCARFLARYFSQSPEKCPKALLTSRRRGVPALGQDRGAGLASSRGHGTAAASGMRWDSARGSCKRTSFVRTTIARAILPHPRHIGLAPASPTIPEAPVPGSRNEPGHGPSTEC